MNRYAIISDGIVSNVIVWDGVTEWQPPDGTTLVELTVDEFCEIGMTYNSKSVPRFS